MAGDSNFRLVIGMPVYNGADLVGETIESILNQSFSDFRLLISDNGSTDNTGEICREYARKDSRIVYFRQKENLGVSGNFNYVFQPNGADYFKWAAHDDILKPDYLRRCIELLDADPSLAMAHCPTSRIDNRGNWLGMYEDLGMASPRISERFWRVLWTVNIYEIFGVMRASVVSNTKPVDKFFGAERNRLAEILLQGNIGYLNESLFSRRDHDGSQTAIHIEAKEKNNYSALQSAQAPKAKMSSKQVAAAKIKAYFQAIYSYPMPLSERIACTTALAEWSVRRTFEGTSGERYRTKLYAKRENLLHLGQAQKA